MEPTYAGGAAVGRLSYPRRNICLSFPVSSIVFFLDFRERKNDKPATARCREMGTRMKTETQSLRTGTKIELNGTPAFGGFPGVAPEQATIARWTAACGPLKNHVGPTNPGWHIVRFSNGGALCIHESNFRVVDNRHSYRPR